MTDTSKYYVFYDGDCGFCNHWVQWILKNDKKNLFLFVALQSEFGQNFLIERNLNRDSFNTLYLWKPEEFYLMKSEAVAKVAYLLGGTSRVLSYLNVFPVWFSDKIYDQIAKNRMKLASEKCLLPAKKKRKNLLFKNILV